MSIQIGPIELDPYPVVLAPMEDVSDPPFRIICKELGADIVYTEFISSGGLLYGAEGSTMKLDIVPGERPVGIQIFGGEVDQVRDAAKIVEEADPDIIDINFGCPVKKVVCKDGGAGILRNIPKMMEITKAVVDVSSKPVTVKTRLGWNDETLYILDVAKRLEDCGIKSLAVHARTRSQMYKGEARWEWLRKLKDESGLAIPIFGNGDASDPVKIKRMFDETGVDGVMVGRGAIGNPWIFRDFKHYLKTGELLDPPEWSERIGVVKRHLIKKAEWLGERKGVLEMRRMYGGYFKGFRNASALRQRIMEETTLEGALDVISNFDIEDDTQYQKVERTARAINPLAIPKSAKKGKTIPV